MLNELAKQLAEVRKGLEDAKNAEKEAEAALEQTPAAAALMEARENRLSLTQAEIGIKDELSAAMLAHAEETGETKFDFGQVVNQKSVIIKDTDAALKWAMDRQICLSLDARAIKKVAEELSPDGVVIEHSKSTRISADLSEYLVGDDE